MGKAVPLRRRHAALSGPERDGGAATGVEAARHPSIGVSLPAKRAA
jgi:hypothetical protein